MKVRRKKNPHNTKLWINTMIGVLCGFIVVVFIIVLLTQTGKPKVEQQLSPAANAQAPVATQTEAPTEAPTEPPALLTYPTPADNLTELTASNISSEHAVLLDVENNTVLAQRDPDARIYPASMTKIMTLLVAAEHIENMDDTFTMTYEIIAPLIEAEASRAGFEEGETVSLKDLMYGIALPSGADATTAIAIYLCGSEDEFVKLMNEKVEELGLKNTHFTNASGLYDPNHYSTATDIAMLMSAVMKNDTCREILGTYQYTTTATEQHPEGNFICAVVHLLPPLGVDDHTVHFKILAAGQQLRGNALSVFQHPERLLRFCTAFQICYIQCFVDVQFPLFAVLAYTVVII